MRSGYSTVAGPGPEFFSAELDATLLRHDVDFCVHSAKDLGDKRPNDIIRAAIPTRENPRDVVVFRADVRNRLERGEPIRIGSSSARRRINIESFLRGALPQSGRQPRLRFRPLRGAVDVRLRRIHIDGDHADALDGVVLAIAGLARLWADADGRAAIVPLLADTLWMVLPPSQCPAAPGQGALAIECRRDDPQTRKLLATLHDDRSAALVQHEIDALARVPESRRAGVGATALDEVALNQYGLGPITYVRGAEQDGMFWNSPPRPRDARAWDGQNLDRTTTRRSLPVQIRPHDSGAVFAAHWRAMTASVTVHEARRIWVSGVTSWRQLAKRGFWVEGCADNLGFASIVPTLMCPVLCLPPLADWTALTHSGAEAGWKMSGVGRVLATYANEPSDHSPDVANLQESRCAARTIFSGATSASSTRQAMAPDRCGPRLRRRQNGSGAARFGRGRPNRFFHPAERGKHGSVKSAPHTAEPACACIDA